MKNFQVIKRAEDTEHPLLSVWLNKTHVVTPIPIEDARELFDALAEFLEGAEGKT